MISSIVHLLRTLEELVMSNLKYLGLFAYLAISYFFMLNILEGFYEDSFVWLALFSLFLGGLIILFKPMLSYWVYFTSIFISFSYIGRFFYSIPSLFRWIPLVMLLVTLSLVVIYPNRKISLRGAMPKNTLFVLIAFVVFGVISGTFNGSSPVQLVLGLRWVFPLVGAMIVTQFYFKDFDRTRLLRVLLIIGIINFPVALIQRVVFVELLNLGSGDMVAGLFAGYRELVFFQTFCILTVLSYKIKGERLLSFIKPYSLVTFYLLTFALSNSRAVWIFIMISVMFLFWIAGREYFYRSLKTFIPLSIVIVTAIFIFDTIMTDEYSSRESFGYLTDLELMQDYVFGDDILNPELGEDGSLKRGEALVYNLNLIKNNLGTLVLGLGPGAISQSNVSGATGSVVSEIGSKYLSRNTLSRILAENGMIGLILFLLMLLSFYKNRRNKTETDEGIVLLRKGTVFLITILLIYYNVHMTEIFGLILAVLFYSNPSKVQRKKR